MRTIHGVAIQESGTYNDVAGFCKSATIEEIKANGYVLTPGRYVGAEAVEDDGEPFDEKMKRLTSTLQEQCAESQRLERAIRENMKGLGYRVSAELPPDPEIHPMDTLYFSLRSGSGIRTAPVRAALSVNRELVLLYWQIGKDVLERQESERLGRKSNQSYFKGPLS